MATITSDSITEIYYGWLDTLRYCPILESRVGATRENIFAISVLLNPYSRLIQDSHRKHSIEYLKGEWLWYMQKTTNIDFIKKYSKFWGTIADASGNVYSNYGNTLFRNINGKSQMQHIIYELRQHPESRRAIALYNYDSAYARMHDGADFPCTVMSHFMVRDNRLNQIVYIRSNDLIYGWSNDMAFYTMIQEMIGVKLGVPLGTLTEVAGSLHIYEKHFNLLNEKHEYPINTIKEQPFPRMVDADVDYFFELTESNRDELKKPDTDFMRFVCEQ